MKRVLPPILAFLLLAACGSLLDTSAGPATAVSLARQVNGPRQLTLEVEVDGRSATLDLPAQRGQADDVLRSARYGDVPAEAELRRAGEVLGRVAFQHSLERHSTHWIATIVGQVRPAGFCMGIMETAPHALRPGQAAPDTMFVMHGSLPEEAVC